MTINREKSLELALGMLVATITSLGSDPKEYVDHASGLILKAAEHLNGAELGASAIAELHKAYAENLAAKQRNES